MTDYELAHPARPEVLGVTVQNWPDAWAKRPGVKRSTTRTYVIDPVGATSGDGKLAQIAEYEPSRCRTVIQVIDAAVALVIGQPPRNSPDTSAAGGPANEGRYLPPALMYEYILFGPDAMWLNSITGGASRVTVTKEYDY